MGKEKEKNVFISEYEKTWKKKEYISKCEKEDTRGRRRRRRRKHGMRDSREYAYS